jgi:hypothetical protein
MTATAANALPHKVFFATEYGNWTEVPEVQAATAKIGVNTLMGSAELVTWSGSGRYPGSTGPAGAMSPIDLLDKWVRIQIFSESDDDFLDCWFGAAENVTAHDRGDGYDLTIGCVGIAGALAKQIVTDGWEVSADLTGSQIIGFAPAFNRIPGGDRSATATSGIYLFDRRGGSFLTGVEVWTIKQALDYLLNFFTAGPAWTLVDIDGQLDVPMPEFDPNGRSIFDILNEVCGQRRGLVWYADSDGATCQVVVRSTVAGALGAETADLTGQLIDSVVIITDTGSTYDEIIAEGAAPWSCATLVYAGDSGDSLEPAWTSAQETAWENGDRVDTESVHRAFRVRSAWTGTQAGETTFGLAEVRTVDGSGQLTGARTFSATNPPLASAYQLTADTPAGLGWTTAPDGVRTAAMAWVEDGGGLFDACAATDEGGLGWSLTVSGDTVTIGTAKEQAVLAEIFANGGKLYVTVGIRLQRHIAVSWVAAVLPRTGHRRTLKLTLPSYEQWRIEPQTWRGLDGGMPDKSGTSPLIVRDDTPDLASIVARARRWYESFITSVSFREHGIIDPAIYGIGRRMATVVVSGSPALPVGTVVTQKAYTFTEDGYGTSVTTERILPDYGAVL